MHSAKFVCVVAVDFMPVFLASGYARVCAHGKFAGQWLAMVSTLLEATAIRLEAIAFRLEAIAIS